MSRGLAIFGTAGGRTTRGVGQAVKHVERKTKALQKELGDHRQGFFRASIFLDRWVQQNFKSEGGKVGKWVPFKAGGRPLAGGEIDTSAKLLQDTGRLRGSFQSFYTPKNAGIASDVPYSKIHEEGIGVPQRRMLPERAEVIADLRGIIKSAKVEAVRRIK